MSLSEAQLRLKINNLLKEAGWLLDGERDDNVKVEYPVTVINTDDDGNEIKTHKSADYVCFDKNNRPIVVIEAKREDNNPLVGKEQAREYAESLNVRYVYLSNGIVHYFWDMEEGNPHIVQQFSTPKSLELRETFIPNTHTLINELVENDYVAITQKPNYATDPRYLDELTRDDFLRENSLMLLRDYQLKTVQSIQQSVNNGNKRFLFEMATGTGKTLIAAAVIKLFLRTSNAKRVLFLVDRIEL